jgi:hypothetical protein
MSSFLIVLAIGSATFAAVYARLGLGRYRSSTGMTN